MAAIGRWSMKWSFYLRVCRGLVTLGSVLTLALSIPMIIAFLAMYVIGESQVLPDEEARSQATVPDWLQGFDSESDAYKIIFQELVKPPSNRNVKTVVFASSFIGSQLAMRPTTMVGLVRPADGIPSMLKTCSRWSPANSLDFPDFSWSLKISEGRPNSCFTPVSFHGVFVGSSVLGSLRSSVSS